MTERIVHAQTERIVVKMHMHVIDNIAYTEIKKSSIHGFGLFASEFILEGTILGVLDGQVMNWDEYDNICSQISLPPELNESFFMEWNALAEDTLLVRPLRTKYSFINHSRTPNVCLDRFPLKVVAARNLQPGEELLLDYRCEPLRKEYLNGHGKTYL